MRGDEELLPGDFLFEGEANHHRRDRGWTYWLHAVSPAGEYVTYRSGISAQKAELKRQGLAARLLTGSGDVAAMVRIAHGLRAGLVVTKSE